MVVQVRDVFAMAATLNRTVILPKLMCYCDRYWGPVDACRIPGAPQTRLPFVCPLDHVLEPFHMDDDPDKFGPPIRFREHSFLDSKQVPDSIRSGVQLPAAFNSKPLRPACSFVREKCHLPLWL